MKRLILGGAISGAIVGAAGAVSADPVTLTMWSQDNAGATGAIVADFNAAQDDIRVELVSRDFSSLVADAVRAFATGNAPDVIEIDNPEVALFSSRGVLLDLTEWAQTAEHFDFDAMLPGPRAAGTWDGKLYAIPKAANTIALYYNADLFEAAGLDPDQPPQTWSELAEYAAVLNDPENGISGLSFSAAANEEGTFQFLPWLQMAGADYDSLDSEGAVKALQFWTDLYQSGNVSPDAISTGQWDLTAVFNAGKTAMHISGPWELSRMKETANFDYRVALLPTMDGSDVRASALGEFMHVINADTEHPEAAKTFVDWYHKNDAEMWNRHGLFPGFSGIDAEPEEFVDAHAVFSEQLKYAAVRGPHPEWPRISRAIQEALQAALAGGVAPDVALKAAAAEVADVLN